MSQYSKQNSSPHLHYRKDSLMLSEQNLKSLEKREASLRKESRRLESVYKSLASHTINDMFRQKVTQFYEEFTQHLHRLLQENSELKEMLKALYNLHVNETRDKEHCKENFEGGYNQSNNQREFKEYKNQLKKKYKNELVKVREVMGSQIRKLENELIGNLQHMKESKRKNDHKFQKYLLELENEKKKHEGRSKEDLEREVSLCKENLKCEFSKEKKQLLEKFEQQLRQVMMHNEKVSQENEEKVEKFKKMCEVMKIENENREYELEKVNQKLDEKDNLIEEINLKLEAKEKLVDKLERRLKRKEDVIDKQTLEVKKLIVSLQERRDEFDGEMKLNYEEIQKNLEFQKHVVRRLELENEELKERMPKQIEMVKQKYEREITRLLKEKNSILDKRERKAESDLTREIKEYLRIINQKDKVISKLRDEKLKTQDQMADVRNKLIQQDKYIKKQDLELLTQKQEFQSKILTLEKDILEFAKIKDDIAELKRRSAKKQGVYNTSSSMYGTHQTVSTFSSTKSNQATNNYALNQDSINNNQGSNPYTTFAGRNQQMKKKNHESFSSKQEGESEEEFEKRQKMVEDVLRKGEHLVKRRIIFSNYGANSMKVEKRNNGERIFKDPNVTKREEKMYFENKIRTSIQPQKKLKNTQSSPVLQNKNPDFQNRKVYHPKPQHPGFAVESLVNSTHPLSTFHNSTIQSDLKGRFEDIEEENLSHKKCKENQNNRIFSDFDLENIGNFEQNELRCSDISFDGRTMNVVVSQSNGKNLKVYGYPPATESHN